MRVGDAVPGELWEAFEPLLPRERPKPKVGRPRVKHRAALAGIAYMARRGCWRRDVRATWAPAG